MYTKITNSLISERHVLVGTHSMYSNKDQSLVKKLIS